MLFLGTGTSVGIPMIGCRCPVCCSTNPRNVRRRASLYVEADGVGLLIDTAPDFREQVLTFGVSRVDAVLFTHPHADHIFGFDDIRRFNTIQEQVIPAYASPETVAELRRIFPYISDTMPKGLFRPQIDFRAVEAPFRVGAIDVQPVDVQHGTDRTYGYRLDWRGRSVGYVPDCHRLDAAAIDAFAGVDIMILDALRYRPHQTHMAVAESLAALEQIGAPTSYLVHLCHDLEHEALQSELPAGVYVSYDGLELSW